MKRFFKAAVILLFLGLIALCGGIHHHTHVRFLPDMTGRSVPDGSDGQFRPEIEPVYTEGGTVGLRCAIPFLWYWQRDMDQKLVISLGLSYTPERLNYDKMSSVVFDKLVVTNEDGKRFDLIREGEERSFDLTWGRNGAGSVKLGSVTGKRLRIEATGYAITRKDGSRSYFTTDQPWLEDRSTRCGPGVCFLP